MAHGCTRTTLLRTINIRNRGMVYISTGDRENSEVVTAGVGRMVAVPLVSIGPSGIGGSCSGRGSHYREGVWLW